MGVRSVLGLELDQVCCYKWWGAEELAMSSARELFFILAALLLGTPNMTNSSGSTSPGHTEDGKVDRAIASSSIDRIRSYISSGWDNLTRSTSDCASYEDTKTAGPRILYLPTEITEPPFLKGLQDHCGVRVERLHRRILNPGEVDLREIPNEGLLYLPNPYVVPGGKFNEMYGWDSYFIIRGLLRENRRTLARGMIENFFFEIEHYGGVLNANRTYYLTRSQPPFLTSMILAQYDADQAPGQGDLKWIEKAYGFALRDYEQWNKEPHLAGDTGLSRYFDHGSGPVPEIEGDPDEYYRGAAQFFLEHGGVSESHLLRIDGGQSANQPFEPNFEFFVCDSQDTKPKDANCAPADRVALTNEFYKGDRSMRESGFDVSFRFGAFGAETHFFAPVCLNSLLYKTEKDLEKMSILLGRKEEARRWNRRAVERRKRMEKYFWDAKRGLFFDYNFKSHERSSYEYATTFYPLWVGLASKNQARAVVQNLAMFEQPGGVVMSRHESGAQWDFPYGWAPVQLLAVEGLRNYGFNSEADKIALSFLTVVMENFDRDQTIKEKYNVVTRSSETNIKAGYSQNVIGFGWTNAVFLELSYGLPSEKRVLLDSK